MANRLKPLALIILLPVLMFSFQNCIAPGAVESIDLPVVDEDPNGGPPAAQATTYVRRYEGEPCNAVQAELEFDGTDMQLQSDNCGVVDILVDAQYIDRESYNAKVFGLGPHIMRALEPGQFPDDAPYDIFFCRSVAELEATDYMLYLDSTGTSTYLHKIKAVRASAQESWVIEEDWTKQVSPFSTIGGGWLFYVREPWGYIFVADTPRVGNPFVHEGVYEYWTVDYGSLIDSADLDCRVRSTDPIGDVSQ